MNQAIFHLHRQTINCGFPKPSKIWQWPAEITSIPKQQSWTVDDYSIKPRAIMDSDFQPCMTRSNELKVFFEIVEVNPSGNSDEDNRLRHGNVA
jgi:hypothetical protein